MGRIRKTLRWTFSFGGTGAGSPIRAESSAEQAAREHAGLMREQNRLLAEQNQLLAGQDPARSKKHVPDPRFSAASHERALRAGQAAMAKLQREKDKGS